MRWGVVAGPGHAGVAEDNVLPHPAGPQPAALARIIRTNPLAPGQGRRWSLPIEDVLGPPWLMAWSGAPVEDMFARDPSTWTKEAWSALEGVCDVHRARLDAAGRRLVFRPQARHVLGDPQRCLKFLLAREEQPFGLALDAAAMLEPSMLERAEEHLARAFESLGGLCDAAILTNAAPDPERDGLTAAPLHKGLLDAGALGGLFRNCCPPDTPVIVLEGDVDAQLDALGA